MKNIKNYRKDYYLKGQEHWRAYARNYYHQHKEQVKKYRLKNKEKLREYDRQYAIYQKNKQSIKIRRYYQDELRDGAEALFNGDAASKAITIRLLPPRIVACCDSIRKKI